MRLLILGILSVILMGCSLYPHEDAPSQGSGARSAVATFADEEIFPFKGTQAFIIWPYGRKAKDWVWFAPSFLNSYNTPPDPTFNAWYFAQLNLYGVAVVGIDVGESFGDYQGRILYEEFYQYLINTRKFNQKGCMFLQSRGGLMGYNWIMDYPGRVACVAGIFPLLTVTDYIGVDQIAAAWGISPLTLMSGITSQSPLERNQALPDVDIFHIHGDADTTVHLSYDQQFIAQKAHAQLTVVPGKGHEFAPEFFHNEGLLDFLLTYVGGGQVR